MTSTPVLRLATPEDESILRSLFVDARSETMSFLPPALVEMQIVAQRRQYETAFPEAQRWLVLLGDEPVGFCWIDEGPTAIHLVDVAVFSEHRNRGLGTWILRELMCRSRAIDLHVDLANPARRLYERLGFVSIDETGTGVRMRWTPG